MPETPFSVAQPKTLGDLVVRVLDADFTYGSGTLLNAGGAAVTFEIGTVLGKVTASGKLVPLAPGASDGSQTVAALLGDRVTVAAGAEAVKLTVDRMAILRDSQVVWPAGITGPQKTTAIGQLASLHILIREDV
jgi:hypothetical protein